MLGWFCVSGNHNVFVCLLGVCVCEGGGVKGYGVSSALEPFFLSA